MSKIVFIETLENCVKNKKSEILFKEGIPLIINYCDEKISTMVSYEKYAYLFFDFNETVVGPIFSNTVLGCPNCFRKARLYNKRLLEKKYNSTQSIILGEYSVDNVIQLLLENLYVIWRNTKKLYYYVVRWDGSFKLYEYYPLFSCQFCKFKEIDDNEVKLLKGLEENIIVDKLVSYYPSVNQKRISEVFSEKNTDSNFFIYINYQTKKMFMVSAYFRINASDKFGVGIGTGRDLLTSKFHAYFEALERFGGMQPRGSSKKVVEGAYNDLKKEFEIVNPKVFLGDFVRKNDLSIYSDEKINNWISCYSWKQKKIALIPESFVYYKFEKNYSGSLKKIYKACSNGNALAGNVLSGIYYACLECIERDAFLNHWYFQYTPKEIKINTIINIKIRYLINAIESMGYDISLFDIRIELEFPVVWAFAEGKSENEFSTYSTAACNHNPIDAICSALNEMLLALEIYAMNIKEIKKRALNIEKNGVKTLEDHPVLYSIASQKHLFDFLHKEEKKYSFDELFPTDLFRGDIKISLKSIVYELLGKLEKNFGDVFIVRQTPLGYEELGLELIKVLIPNTQQLWFGKQYQMISKVRIDQIKEKWKCGDQINMEPHPFP